MSDKLVMFKHEVEAFLRGRTMAEWEALHPGEHLWARFGEGDCCALCGIVRRSDDGNKPCRGKVHLTFRAPALEDGGGDSHA